MEQHAEVKESSGLRLLREKEGSEVRSPTTDAEPKKAQEKSKGPVTRLRIAIAISLVLVAVFGWWLYARQFEGTDDAQTDGNISAISPRVAGTVIAVHVVDNQSVKAGDLLVELDPSDLEVAVAQGEAALAQAEAAYEADKSTASPMRSVPIPGRFLSHRQTSMPPSSRHWASTRTPSSTSPPKGGPRRCRKVRRFRACCEAHRSSVSQRTIFLLTKSGASRWTKWPAPGTVISVRSFSIHFQVPSRAPDSRYGSSSP